MGHLHRDVHFKYCKVPNITLWSCCVHIVILKFSLYIVYSNVHFHYSRDLPCDMKQATHKIYVYYTT